MMCLPVYKVIYVGSSRTYSVLGELNSHSARNEIPRFQLWRWSMLVLTGLEIRI